MTLVDEICRIICSGKRGAIPANLARILDRLDFDLDLEAWLDLMRAAGSFLGGAFSRTAARTREAIRRGARWIVDGTRGLYREPEPTAKSVDAGTPPAISAAADRPPGTRRPSTENGPGVVSNLPANAEGRPHRAGFPRSGERDRSLARGGRIGRMSKISQDLMSKISQDVSPQDLSGFLFNPSLFQPLAECVEHVRQGRPSSRDVLDIDVITRLKDA